MYVCVLKKTDPHLEDVEAKVGVGRCGERGHHCLFGVIENESIVMDDFF